MPCFKLQLKEWDGGLIRKYSRTIFFESQAECKRLIKKYVNPVHFVVPDVLGVGLGDGFGRNNDGLPLLREVQLNSFNEGLAVAEGVFPFWIMINNQR